MPPEIATIIIVAMVGGFALVSKLMREIFRRRELGDGGRHGDTRFAEISQKLETLQHSIDATAIEVERLGEGLRFTTKLLAEKSGAWDAPRAPDRVITPH